MIAQNENTANKNDFLWLPVDKTLNLIYTAPTLVYLKVA
jgi:hypothetical protein